RGVAIAGTRSRQQPCEQINPARWVERCRLQDDSLVVDAACDSLAIEILQQRDGVFAGDAEQVLELRHAELGRLRLVGDDSPAQRLERVAVKHQVVGQLYQD